MGKTIGRRYVEGGSSIEGPEGSPQWSPGAKPGPPEAEVFLFKYNHIFLFFLYVRQSCYKMKDSLLKSPTPVARRVEDSKELACSFS